MKREKLLKLGPYAAFLQRRWRLVSARAAGSLRNAFAGDYKEKKAPFLETFRIHSKGWSVDDWRMCCGGMDDAKACSAMSTADYRRMHPVNGAYSTWIDDKLTLMYLCQSADLKRYVPNYYFQISDGSVLSLPDCPGELRGCGPEGVLTCLERFGELAIKQAKGSLGEGFYKAEVRNSEILIGRRSMSSEEFLAFLGSLDGYLVMEYLHPHSDIGKFSAGTANTVRYLVANVKGSPLFLRSFVRFGTTRSGFVENYNSGGVLCFADEDGFYSGGKVMDDAGGNVRISEHPDTSSPLNGRVPLWDEMRAAATTFCAHFPQLKYLGFDFVASDDGVKMLEINSLSSLDCIQLDGPVFDLPNGWWFRERLDRANGKV